MALTPLTEITDSEFALFCNLLEESIGLCLRTREKRLVANRLQTRLHELGLKSFLDYYRLVTQGPTPQLEIAQLVDALTTQKTDFFRHLGQFEHFRYELVPELIRRLRAREVREVKIWSAGCSTGEEPYSLAILLMETVPFGLFHSFSILATDISERALTTATEGRYPARRMEEVDPGLLTRYFEPDEEGHYKVRGTVRRLVRFQKHNLNGGLWSPSRFDVVFCRNVLIYFQPPLVECILDRFHRCLNREGVLYLGQTECLPRGLTCYERLAPSIYRRLPAGESGATLSTRSGDPEPCPEAFPRSLASHTRWGRKS